MTQFKAFITVVDIPTLTDTATVTVYWDTWTECHDKRLCFSQFTFC